MPVALEPVTPLEGWLGMAGRPILRMYGQEEAQAMAQLIAIIQGQFCLAQIHTLCFNGCTIRYRECIRCCVILLLFQES